MVSVAVLLVLRVLHVLLGGGLKTVVDTRLFAVVHHWRNVIGGSCHRGLCTAFSELQILDSVSAAIYFWRGALFSVKRLGFARLIIVQVH